MGAQNGSKRSEPATADQGPAGPVVARPLPLVVSMWAGAAGALLLGSGLILSLDAALLVGLVAGVVSLSAALVWRSQLIDAWSKQRGPAPSRRQRRPESPR
ncbi:MAG: hypothetical protein ACT4OS_08440 [Acidimicrobiales bacterium]